MDFYILKIAFVVSMKNGAKNDDGWNHLAVGRDQVELPTVLSCGQSFR